MNEAVIVRPGVYVIQRIGPDRLTRAAEAVARHEPKTIDATKRVTLS